MAPALRLVQAVRSPCHPSLARSPSPCWQEWPRPRPRCEGRPPGCCCYGQDRGSLLSLTATPPRRRSCPLRRRALSGAAYDAKRRAACSAPTAPSPASCPRPRFGARRRGHRLHGHRAATRWSAAARAVVRPNQILRRQKCGRRWGGRSSTTSLASVDLKPRGQRDDRDRDAYKTGTQPARTGRCCPSATRAARSPTRPGAS